MEQLSGLQLQQLILNKGGDCGSDGGGRAKGRAAGPEESGVIVAAAAVGGLPRRWGDRERAEGGPSPLLVFPVVKFRRLSLPVPVSLTLPVSLSPAPVPPSPAPSPLF